MTQTVRKWSNFSVICRFLHVKNTDSYIFNLKKQKELLHFTMYFGPFLGHLSQLLHLFIAQFYFRSFFIGHGQFPIEI